MFLVIPGQTPHPPTVLNPVPKTQEGAVPKHAPTGVSRGGTWCLGKRSLKAEEPVHWECAGYFALELGAEVVHLHGLHVFHKWRLCDHLCDH